MRQVRSRVIVGLVAGLVTVAVGACASPPAATGTADGRAVLRYQDYGPSLTALPVLQAKTAGLYAAHGVELAEGTPIYNSGQLVQSLLQGEADVVVAGGSAALAAVAQGQQVRVVGNLSSPQIQISLTAATLARLAGHGVTPASPVDVKVGALKGLRLASHAAGTQNDLHFRYLLTRYGLAPEQDLLIQPFSDATAIVAAARQGSADGLVSVPPQTLLPETEGWGAVFVDFAREAPDLVAIPGTAVLTTPRFLEQNPDAVRGFLAAMAESREALRKGDVDPAALRQAYFPNMDPKTFDASFRSLQASLDAPMTVRPEQFALMVDVLGAGAAGRPDVTFDEFFDATPSQGLEKDR